MSFQDEMTQMSPEQVRQAVRERMVEGRGVPWSEARGEPQWGLLRSSFLVWKQQQEQLDAFQAEVTEALTEAASAGRWGVVSEAAELCVALEAVEPKPNWAIDQWPVLEWLSNPSASDDRLRASVALLQLTRIHELVDTAWCVEQFGSSVTRLFDGRTNPQRDRELQWLLSVWKALASNVDANPLPWFDIFRAVATVSDDRRRERLYDLALAPVRQTMTSAHAQAAIHALEQTSSRADKELVLNLMEENWCSLVPGCKVALQVATNRLGRATQVAEATSAQNRISLRSPATSGATRWSELCPAE